MEIVKDFIFFGSRITAYSDCSHEIKRHFLLGRKATINLDNVLKSRGIALPTKVHLVKAMVFPVVPVGIWSRSPVQSPELGADALGWPREMGWEGMWEGDSGWGTHVNPCLIHVNVWQKPLQYCKVISLQLIKINEKKKGKNRALSSYSWTDPPKPN